jgi:predicted Zn finger-like uncharacterized protein
MPIQSSCPACKTTYNLPDAQRGKRVRCRKCSKTFVVVADEDVPVLEEEEPAEVLPAVEDVEEVAPAREERVRPERASIRPRPVAAGPRRRGREEDEEEDEDEEDDYREDRPRKSAAPLILLAAFGGLLLLGGGGALAYVLLSGDEAKDQQANVTPPDNNPTPPRDVDKTPVKPPDNPRPPDDKGGTPIIQPPPANNPLAPPKDLDEALAMLRDSNPDRRRVAAEWLRNAPLQVSRQPDVAKALNPLLDDSRTVEPGVGALKKWATKDNVPSLIKALDNPTHAVWQGAMDTLGRLRDERAAKPLVDQLLQPPRRGAAEAALRNLGRVAEKEVIKHFLNKAFFVRTAVANLLRNYGTADGVILDQVTDDLESSDADTRRLAAEEVGKRPVDAGRQAKVAKALDGLLADKELRVRQAALRAEEKWATPDSVPSLVGALDDNALRRQAITVLGKLKDERAAAPLALLLDRPGDRRSASRALQEIGPKAEAPVIQALSSTDKNTRREAVRILGAIGTRKSISWLQKLGRLELARRDMAMANECKAAIVKIASRK